MKEEPKFSAIILAAGLSSRMGSPKMLLEWHDSTVVETVLKTVVESAFNDVVLVYGAWQNEILDISGKFPIRAVFNPDYSNGSMLVSLQTGLRYIDKKQDGFMIILGDQPMLSKNVIEKVTQDYQTSGKKVVIPSYNMRRGHPWLIDNSLIKDVLGLEEPRTLRDFLKNHDTDIYYSIVDDPGILADLDTPEDYQKHRNV
jgi:molybdenum cofactor cytidylyltransferase